MPKIQWANLPPALRHHLFERLREREIRVEDLYQLKLWRESEPEAPEGEWYKDFGSFKICGEGKYPKTFLLRGHPAKGKKLQFSRGLRRCQRKMTSDCLLLFVPYAPDAIKACTCIYPPGKKPQGGKRRVRP